ncbi:MAG: sulfotransferase, partial [Methyloligellaceae bacterium]
MGQGPAIERYFVCIGAQKAGTTWLARVLSRHDQVFVTPVKEIHYFDHIAGLTNQLNPRKRRSRYRKYHQRMWTQWHKWREYRAQAPWYRAYMRAGLDDAWYASLFGARGGKKVAGEATPEYALIGETGLGHIKRLAPDARIIYIMRDPVTRAWSQLLHQCRAQRKNADAVSVEEFAA